MTRRPACRVCGQPVDRLWATEPGDPTDAIYIAYPCQHWHTPDQARAFAAAMRATTREAA